MKTQQEERWKNETRDEKPRDREKSSDADIGDIDKTRRDMCIRTR